ncbi:MAG: hypothetical protein J0H73_13605 [Salana multivorans]|uniref:hypothetical protein n=1 Tax=Salana multivorans TaxID=120377 RepID=UPI0009635266|nr:hypothetical protein [Salana multivorans]MBN8883336.1 hypothetical protein [Salana multivorans]OJX98423.1 MAG: hypothetical protein BGO96_04475 [Micrococcales bacterium 73-15]
MSKRDPREFECDFAAVARASDLAYAQITRSLGVSEPSVVRRLEQAHIDRGVEGARTAEQDEPAAVKRRDWVQGREAVVAFAPQPGPDPAESEPPDDLDRARELRDLLLQRSPALDALLARLKGQATGPPRRPAPMRRRRREAVGAPEPDSDGRLRFTLAVVVAYCNGATQQEIATARGVHVQTIRTVLRDAGVKPREHNATFTAEELQTIRGLHAGGMSARELGRHYGVVHTTILRQLR